MKYRFIFIVIAVLGLCGCKGRTASVPEANGDTVEVTVHGPEEAADTMTAPATPAEVAEETPTEEAVNAPVEHAAGAAREASGGTRRLPPGDPSF